MMNISRRKGRRVIVWKKRRPNEIARCFNVDEFALRAVVIASGEMLAWLYLIPTLIIIDLTRNPSD
jgi:hypothetical protein